MATEKGVWYLWADSLARLPKQFWPIRSLLGDNRNSSVNVLGWIMNIPWLASPVPEKIFDECLTASSKMALLSLASDAWVWADDGGGTPCCSSKFCSKDTKHFKLFPHCKIDAVEILAPTWETAVFTSSRFKCLLCCSTRIFLGSVVAFELYSRSRGWMMQDISPAWPSSADKQLFISWQRPMCTICLASFTLCYMNLARKLPLIRDCT